jgi:hypothetical protein
VVRGRGNGCFGRIREDAVLRRDGLERRDAGHVGLQREHLDVEHQLHGSVNESGTPAGASGKSFFTAAVARLDRLDAALDLAHVVHVAIEAAIAGAELMADALDSPPIQSRMPCASAAGDASSGLAPEPKSMKATRGSRIIGSGSFGDAQLIADAVHE